VKAGIPAARRIFARVCRDIISRCLKFEDQLQANLNLCFGPRTKWKGAKIRKLIEDKIRKKFCRMKKLKSRDSIKKGK
jgi:hypothetical protein